MGFCCIASLAQAQCGIPCTGEKDLIEAPLILSTYSAHLPFTETLTVTVLVPLLYSHHHTREQPLFLPSASSSRIAAMPTKRTQRTAPAEPTTSTAFSDLAALSEDFITTSNDFVCAICNLISATGRVVRSAIVLTILVIAIAITSLSLCALAYRTWRR